ncbi:hypothetical protein K8R03_03380 [Candidatus Kaiserbacteria bacterium]|nr:hypothetical protein [Candidatus Kaiserbacteria bacterium]
MKAKTFISIAVVVVVLGGGWLLYSKPAQPLTTLAPLTKSALAATATLSPAQPVSGQKTKMTFSFTDASGKPVTDLMVHHGSHVHVVIVGKDLATLGHIHPEDFTTDIGSEVASGVYSVEYAFPEAGQYLVAVDVMNAKDELSQQFVVDVTGEKKMAASPSNDMSLAKCVTGHMEEGGVDRYVDPIDMSEAEVPCPGAYKVTLTPASKTIVAGENTLLRFRFEEDGKPVHNLVPYLGAALHLAIVPESFDFALHRHGSVDEGAESDTEEAGVSTGEHSHAVIDTSGIHIMADGSVMLANGTTVPDATVTASGMIRMPDGTVVKPAMDMRAGGDMEGMHHDDVPAAFGPDLISEPIQFPKAGMYRIFAQVKHGHEIVVAGFMLEVQPAAAAAAAAAGESKSFDLVVKNKKVVSGSGDIQVHEGDAVTLTVTNDTDEEVHLHGYDVMTELKAGVPGTITFTASATGRFPFELEGSKTDIGAVSVMPR